MAKLNTTIYPTRYAGYVAQSDDHPTYTTWAALYGAAAATDGESYTNIVLARTAFYLNTFTSIIRGGLVFNVSALGKNYPYIYSATLGGFIKKNKHNDLPSAPFDLYFSSFTPGSYTEFGTADYAVAKFGSTVLASSTYDDLDTNGTSGKYNTFTLSSDSYSLFKSGGYAGIGMRNKKDATNDSTAYNLAGNQGYTMYPQSITGTTIQDSEKANLYIEYEDPDSGGFRYRKGGTTYKVVTFGIDPGGVRLEFQNDGGVYYMPLCSPDDDAASKYTVRVGGATKAGYLLEA